MQNAVDLNGRYRRALKGGQQDTAQGVTQRQAEAALQRFRNDFAAVRVVAVGNIQLGRFYQLLPVLLYHIVLFEILFDR